MVYEFASLSSPANIWVHVYTVLPNLKFGYQLSINRHIFYTEFVFMVLRNRSVL